ncbi:MAG: protein for maturation of antibiotic MccB17 [Candidatus Pelagibacter sp.]|nr:protein for maturation of antibiotic MccB17 [Candidatus Pelagibacter sp.]OUV87725.1 MAG: protein for maturation of antibiotic MccB17 [Pelagibacteraceae bacterium TMED136]|tara:strand:- start:13122 stop:14441 length:1320 start_codon:yes stop_codon:yes gene_type:complete
MLKSKEYLSDIADKCIKIAKKLGASDVEISVSNIISDTINYRNKKKEQSDRSEILSLGLITYIDKKKSNVSTSNFDEYNLTSLIERCMQHTRISPEDEFVGLPDKDSLEINFKNLDLYDPKLLSHNFKEDFLADMEDEMFSNPKIKNSNGSSFTEVKSNFIFANSIGFCEGYNTSSYSVFCEALAEDNNQMERDYEFNVSRYSNKLGNPRNIGKYAADKACKRLGARKIKSGKIPIIFDKNVSKTILSLFSSAITGSAFARGTTFLKNYLGKEIFCKEVNILDDPLIKQGMGSQCFDSEGVKNQKISLVKNGKFNELILDTYYSKILKTKTNGRSGGTTNLYIENGKNDLKKVIRDQKKAFFVTELMGRAGDITNGNYSVGASGIMIDNGELAYAVNEVTIASNLLDMFKNILPLNDLQFKTSTNSPSLLVKSMTVAGK